MYLMWSAGNPNLCKFDKSLSSQEDETTWTCDLSSTYTQTFATMFHLESQLQSYHSIISYINGFLIGLLMLNVLIAIVTNYFMIALEKGDQSFWRNRMQFVVECQSLFGAVSFLGLCRNDLVSELENHHGNNTEDAIVLDNWDKDKDDEEQHPMINTHDLNDTHNEGQRTGNDNDECRDETISIHTESSRTEKVLLQRIPFGLQSWGAYKRKMGSEEKRFFRWWFDQINDTNVSMPSIKIRLTHFFKYAAIEEIMFPGKEYENIILGIQYNKHERGYKLLLARLASYAQSIVNIILIVCMFILGIVTFGLLWHHKMKEHLFCVKEMEMNDQHIEKADEMKQELLENLEDYEINQEKKLDKIFKKQEEKGKKQYTKIAKQQKEFTKKQRTELEKIDRYLAEIRGLLNEMSVKEKD